MFKHFATVTIAITVCVAVFADGEGKEMVGDQVATIEARNQALKVEAKKLGERHLGAGKMRASAERRSYMAFAPEEPEQAITSTENSVGPQGAVRPIPNLNSCNRGAPPQAANAQRRCPPPMRGGSASQSAAGPPQANGPSQAQVERIMEASRARSGGVE
jgi:hypothetical protein